MKLFTKISFIVVAVALGLGILGIGAGVAMGADVRDLSEIGIYISPHQQVGVSGVIWKMEDEIQDEAEDVMEDTFEEWFDYDDVEDFEFEHRHHKKHL